MTRPARKNEPLWVVFERERQEMVKNTNTDGSREDEMTTVEVSVTRRYTVEIPQHENGESFDVDAYLFALNGDDIEQVGQDCGDEPVVRVLSREES